MVSISAAMGRQFVEIVTEMHERILALGPSPLRADPVSVADEEEPT